MSDEELEQTLEDLWTEREIVAPVLNEGRVDFEPSPEAWAIWRKFVTSTFSRS